MSHRIVERWTHNWRRACILSLLDRCSCIWNHASKVNRLNKHGQDQIGKIKTFTLLSAIGFYPAHARQ